MRKFISGLLAIAAAAFTGCYESGTDADNTSREARISISPAAIGFDADGRTTDGLAFGTYIVTVNPYGKMYSDWHAELVGTDWATLDYHTASPDGAVEKALRITCSANTDYKRTGTLRVTLSKTGESVDFPITQVGLKPDATLTLSTESDIEMMALEPAEVTVTFETNMPASTVTAELEEGVEWLTCTLDREAGTVVLAASDNTSPTDMREATVTVSAGTEDTSLATRQIKVRQLANETYLFIYGSGIPHFAAFGDAAQMNKNDLVFGLDHYFRSGKVILSTSRTPDAYPRYALTADGKLAVLADAAAEAAAPELTFGIAGMNALRVTIALDDDNNVVAADSKAEFTRISTVNSMPESELAGYPTKEYVTRDGKTKTWMTTGLHWNGGAAMGTYKLGSGLVGGSKTGGYDEAEYSMRNPAYDTEENGGTLKELMMPDARFGLRTPLQFVRNADGRPGRRAERGPADAFPAGRRRDGGRGCRGQQHHAGTDPQGRPERLRGLRRRQYAGRGRPPVALDAGAGHLSLRLAYRQHVRLERPDLRGGGVVEELFGLPRGGCDGIVRRHDLGQCGQCGGAPALQGVAGRRDRYFERCRGLRFQPLPAGVAPLQERLRLLRQLGQRALLLSDSDDGTDDGLEDGPVARLLYDLGRYGIRRRVRRGQRFGSRGALCEKLREFLNPERAGRENVPVRPGLRPWNDNE